jgi:hypothetical protein
MKIGSRNKEKVEILKITIRVLVVLGFFISIASAKDKSNDYEMGVYQFADVVADGTTTNNIQCGDPAIFTGAVVCGGGIYENSETTHTIKVDGGTWVVETRREFDDSQMRKIFHDTSLHLRHEVDPLVGLHTGDKVLFRIGDQRKHNADIYVPLPTNPGKETKYLAWFHSDSEPTPGAPKTDNVKAMCDSHKLSPELEKKYCPEK